MIHITSIRYSLDGCFLSFCFSSLYLYRIIIRTIVLKNKEKDLGLAALCDANIRPPPQREGTLLPARTILVSANFLPGTELV